MEEAIRAMANRKAVGADGLPVELLKVLVDAGDSGTLGNFYEIVVAVWRQGRVPQQWKDATMSGPRWPYYNPSFFLIFFEINVFSAAAILFPVQ